MVAWVAFAAMGCGVVGLFWRHATMSPEARAADEAAEDDLSVW